MSCGLSFSIQVTGDCSNTSSGAFQLDISGFSPPYSISGSTGVIPLPGTTYLQTGLSAGTYYYAIIDPCYTIPTDAENFSVYISSGTSVNIIDSKDTLCNLDNGSLTAQTTNYYNYPTFSLYGSGGLIYTSTTVDNNFIAQNLSADTYYVVADDGGGCTGKTSNVIIQSSSTLDFGFYVVNDTPCNPTSTTGIGKLFVINVTGPSPITYLWSNGQTGSTITGLTSDTYGVTVTDGTGCSITKTQFVDKVESPGVGLITVQQPTCFSADGEVTILVTGGTAPYRFSASTGTEFWSLSDTVTFTGLTAGLFSLDMSDAGLCKFSTSVFLVTPNSFDVTLINSTNSNCGNSDGQIYILIQGGSSLYTYSYTDSSGNTQSVNKTSTSHTFDSLPNGTYTITISNLNGPCVYTGTTTILNNNKFILTKTTTGTTCNLPNGAVTLMVSGGSGNYFYEITGPQNSSVNSALSSNTFTNLVSGSYVGSVTDLTENCKQYINFNISSSANVNLILSQIPSVYGSDGEIQAIITSGTPPFILNWSSNVGSQTGLHLTGLTAGTYTLTVIDSSGCTITRSVDLTGYKKFSSGQTFNLCSNNFVESGTLIRGAEEMLIEGFYDLTSGETDCVLNKAIFSVETILSGETKTLDFYTGTSLNDFPTQSEWGDAVTLLLESYGYVGQVIANVIENSLKIISVCDNDFPLLDANAIVNLIIKYDIKCIECGSPTPTPTQTPTLTPTSTLGSTPTPTPTNTSTSTNTPTPTSTPTLTPTTSTIPVAFISTWRTTSPLESITLPYVPTGVYSGTIDWGDGNTSVNSYANRTHSYSMAGYYDVKIYGSIEGWDFGGPNGGDRYKIYEVKQWGIPIKGINNSNERMFYFCANLEIDNVSDVLNMVGITSTTSMFEGCYALTTVNNMNSWNTSSVIKMNRMFYDDFLFNQNISSWNVSNVEEMTSTFHKAEKFNQNIGGWITSAVTKMDLTFAGDFDFNANISSWDVRKVTTMLGMFSSAKDFSQNISSWVVSGVTNMSEMFKDADSFNQNISSWDVSNVTNMDKMFEQNNIFNQDLNSWCVGNVITYTNFDSSATSWVLPRPNFVSPPC